MDLTAERFVRQVGGSSMAYSLLKNSSRFIAPLLSYQKNIASLAGILACNVLLLQIANSKGPTEH